MDKLFLQIFNTAITAGWLVLAVLMARLLLKKAPAWIKCALWALVALRLVWPFSLESVLSLLPSTEVIPQSQLYVPAPQVHTGISALNAAINPGFSEAFQAAPTNSVNPLQVALWIAGLIWVLGVVAMVVYAIVSYLRLYRQVRIRVPAEEGVYLCDQIHTPFILGIFKPKIYLPSDLPKEKWDSILAHERAHLVRRDHWWKPLGFVLLTVFWFHPLLWLAYILLCRDVELACDERVIKGFSSEEKQAYSAALLECSIPLRWITACPLAFGETGVKQRIRAMLHYKKPTLWILLVALVVSSALVVCFLTDPVKSSQGNFDPNADVPGPAEFWKEVSQVIGNETGSFQLEDFPQYTFTWQQDQIAMARKGKNTVLIENVTVCNLGAADLNLDGYPELCATVFTETAGEYVLIYDIALEKTYTMQDPGGEFGYYLYISVVDTEYILMCAKYDLETGTVAQAGRLLFENSLPAIKKSTLHQLSGETVKVLYDIYHPDSANQGQVELEGFGGVYVGWYFRPNVIGGDRPFLVVEDRQFPLFEGYPMPTSLYLTDVTGDGKMDVCANVYHHFSGVPSYNGVCVYDYANDRYYILANTANMSHVTNISYYIHLEGGKLVCQQVSEYDGSVLASGSLYVEGSGDEAVLRMQVEMSYDSPVDYSCGESGLYQVELKTTNHDAATLYYYTWPESGGFESGALRGTYEKKDGKLIFTTEDGDKFTFRFEGENLVFLANRSSAVPEHCVLLDNMVLTAKKRYE